MAAGYLLGIDQNGRRGTDHRVARSGGDRILALAELAQPFIYECLVDRAVETLGVGALLRGIREDAAPFELGLVEEAQQLIVVGFGFARIADDEVRAEGRIRLAAADVADAAQKPVAIAPATHAA